MMVSGAPYYEQIPNEARGNYFNGFGPLAKAPFQMLIGIN